MIKRSRQYSFPACFLMILGICLMFPSKTSSLDMYNAVLRDFNGMVDAWSSENYELLWEYGNNPSKSTVPKENFVARMKAGRWGLIAGWEKARDIEVNLKPPILAYVRAKMTFVDRRIGSKVDQTRQFQLIYEEGYFRVSLLNLLY